MLNKEELDLQRGVSYLENNNLVGLFRNYSLTQREIEDKKIWCLDEFYIYPDTEENIEKNINVKWDLEEIAQSGSCAGLATYIFELMKYIQKN